MLIWFSLAEECSHGVAWLEAAYTTYSRHWVASTKYILEFSVFYWNVEVDVQYLAKGLFQLAALLQYILVL
jgi:hypothetical protein